ncbi:MAG: DUF3179 domain-containing protein [Nitrospinae bacterium]|nr:DUF3179 domain-containing protein [Nitrospinota bacterium]
MKVCFKSNGIKRIGWVLLWVALSGWDFSEHSIPLNDILSGGPAKDGIPAIDRPRFVPASQASRTFLDDGDRVMALMVNGKKKVYPLKIINWHEIVNDSIGGRRVVVTFCPLCGTGMVFDAHAAGRPLNFGVSGLLYKSNVLLYDRQTESLWSQIKQEAVTGKLIGTRLQLIPSTQTTWGAWKKQHPDTLVLSTQTGYDRDYERDPYQGYFTSREIFFPVGRLDHRYHPKEQVIGVQLEGLAKAYPFSELARVKSPFKDKVGKKTVCVLYDSKSRTATIKDESGKELPSVVVFWFAWHAFHPDTQVYTAKNK